MKKLIILFFSILSLSAFGQVKISDMPAATSLAGTELIPIVQGGINKKATVALWPYWNNSSINTNSGLKTFLDGTLGMRNVANTFTSHFTNTNSAARTYTLSDATGFIPVAPTALGASLQVLRTNAGATALEWATPSSGFSDPMTTRGDLIYRNASNVTARLGRGTANQVLGSDGTDVSWQSNGNPLNNPWFLRNNITWLEYYQRIMDTNADDVRFGILGDSKIEFGVIPQQLTEVLGKKVKVMGQGYMPFTATTPNLFNATGLNNTSTWTVHSMSSGTGNPRNLAVYSLESTVSSASLGWTINAGTNKEWNKFNNIEIGWWGKVGGGTFDVYVDGVFNITVNTASLTGVQTTLITGLTDAPHSITLDPTAANAEILHFRPYRTTVNTLRGFQIHCFGQSGAMVSNYLARNTATWDPQFTALDLHLLSIYLGTNERHNAVSLATFKSNMKTFVAQLKVLKPEMDIVLWGQVAEDDANPYFSGAIATAAQYNAVLKEVAEEDRLAFFDPNLVAFEYAFNSQKPWLSDGIHESIEGATIEARQFFNGLPSLTGAVNVLGEIARNSGTDIYNNGLGGTGIDAGTGSTIRGGTITGDARVNTPIVNLVTSDFLPDTYAGEPKIKSGALTGVKLLSTNQGAPVTNWDFVNGYGINRDFNQTSNFFRLNQGWKNPNFNNYIATQLNLDFEIDKTDGATTGTVFRGLWIHPTLTSLVNSTYIGFETESGETRLNSVSGNVRIGGGASASQLRFLEPSGSGSNYASFEAPTLAADNTYTLPNAYPSVSGQVLSSTNTGTMSWVSAGGGGTYYAPSTLVANATDANFTATLNGVHNILDGVASTNRVITIPTGSNGDVMKFFNTEDTYIWSFTGATVYLEDRVTVETELRYNVSCFMEKIDGRWIITN